MQKIGTTVIQVVRNAKGAHAAMIGAFSILDFPDDPGLVYLETPTDNLWLEKADEYQRYSLIFNHVMSSADSPEESLTHMEGIVDRLQR